MDNSMRQMQMPFSELLDRLSIDQIKQFKNTSCVDFYSKEMRQIQSDINLIVEKCNFNLNARFTRLIIALAQFNLHIWYSKERMLKNVADFHHEMKLSHQLNGIRNQIKNCTLEECGLIDKAPFKTNTSSEDLEGWFVSVLVKAEKNPKLRTKKKNQRQYQFAITDLIDTLTINQIKETLFSNEKQKAVTNEIEMLSFDLDLFFEDNGIKNMGRFVRLVMLVSLANLIIWKNKDEMLQHEEKYDELLEFAQDINWIRNHARNCLMQEFGEAEPCRLRSTYLEINPGKWYLPLLQDMDQQQQ